MDAPPTPPSTALPPQLPTHSLISAYSRFLIHNATTVSSVESAIRSATYLLPGRFEGAEIASEGVHSLLALLSSLHTTLLNTHLSTLPPFLRPQLPPPSPHERYTRAWSRDSPTYRYAARALVVLGHVQLLGEMLALRGWGPLGTGRGGEDAKRKRRWRWLVGVEGVKTILRLILLVLTRRPLIHPPLPQTTFDPSILLPPPASSSSSPPPPRPSPPTIICKDPVQEILLPKTLFVGSLTPGKELVRPLRTGREVTGELLWAARGLIYVLMLKSSSSTLPVLISFLSQLLSAQLLAPKPPKPSPNGFAPTPTSTAGLTTVEREERARRSRAMGGFLFRGAVWEGVTKPTLESVASKTSKIPLLGMVGGVLNDYLPLVDEYYYYTAD